MNTKDSRRIAALLAEPGAAALLAAFAAEGVPARIVGGAVRDAVMDRPPGDIDIATPMPPKDVLALAKRKGWKGVPTGIEHGTVTVVIDGVPYEVTTLRRDVETDGRRAVVAFTADFREDAFRRDFTLNALSLSADGMVHDYATGVADAKAGRIRFMGAPEQRIREDYLRILRFFRFQASHGRGAPDAEAMAACAALKAGMAQLSRERVRQELLKLIAAPGAVAAAEAMQAIGLWPQVLPDSAVDLAAFRRWAAMAGAFPEPPDAVAGLAVLTPASSTEALAESLRLSRVQLAALDLIRDTGALALDGARLREAMYRIGPAAYPSVLRAAAALSHLTIGQAQALMAQAAPLLQEPPPRNPFRSVDAAALGIPAGPRMGQVLRAAEAAWIAAGLPDDSREVAAILSAAAIQHAD